MEDFFALIRLHVTTQTLKYHASVVGLAVHYKASGHPYWTHYAKVQHTYAVKTPSTMVPVSILNFGDMLLVPQLRCESDKMF